LTSHLRLARSSFTFSSGRNLPSLFWMTCRILCTLIMFNFIFSKSSSDLAPRYLHASIYNKVSLFLVFGFVSSTCSTSSLTVLSSLFVVIFYSPFLYCKYIIHQTITNVKSKNKKEQRF